MIKVYSLSVFLLIYFHQNLINLLANLTKNPPFPYFNCYYLYSVSEVLAAALKLLNDLEFRSFVFLKNWKRTMASSLVMSKFGFDPRKWHFLEEKKNARFLRNDSKRYPPIWVSQETYKFFSQKVPLLEVEPGFWYHQWTYYC